MSSTYNNTKELRFWCQKVLPLVYDDSLSYYELLNKVVVYLNSTIEDVQAMIADVTRIEQGLSSKIDLSQKGVANGVATLNGSGQVPLSQLPDISAGVQTISVNGVNVPADSNKNVNIVVMTNAVSNLVNYYLKSETYSKGEVNALIDGVKNSRFEVVSQLPTTDIQTNVIYLVPKSVGQTQNGYDEYINLNGTTSGWELIGTTDIDLSGYVTDSELATALSAYVTTQSLNTTLAGYVTSGVLESTLQGYVQMSAFNSLSGTVVSQGESIANLATAVNGKVDKVTGKGLSTNDYGNTDKGIVDGIQGYVVGNTELIGDTVGWTGKNLIAFPYEVTVFPNTNHGVVFNLGDENKIIATSGTATGGNTNLALSSRLETSEHCLRLPKGRYILNGNPKNASNHDFYLFVATTLNDAYSAIGTTQDVDEFIIDVTDEMMEGRGYAPIAVYVVVRQNVTANGEVFEPMLRKANVLDGTYEPYHASVENTLRSAEVIEGKNLYNSKATSKTDAYGLTWTVDPNDENIITVSGTPTGFEQFNTNSYDVLPTGNYIISGILENTNNIKINTVFLRNDSTNVQEITFTLRGSEYLFSIPQNVSYNNLLISLKRDTNGVECSGTVKLMVRKATETDNTYEPYYVPLKDSMFPREEQRVLGAKNLLKNNMINHSSNDVSFTVNSDKSISLTGTSSNNIDSNTGGLIGNISNLPKGKYKLTGCPSGGSTSTYRLVIVSSATPLTYIVDTGNGIEFEVTDNSTWANVYIRINANINMDNKVYKPMIRLASDTDNTYVPYVMTNKELTNMVNIEEGTITSSQTIQTDMTFIRKIGNIINCQIRLQNVTATVDDVIAIIPAGFRPNKTLLLPVLSAQNISYALVYTSGNIKLGTGVTNSNLTLCSSIWTI